MKTQQVKLCPQDFLDKTGSAFHRNGNLHLSVMLGHVTIRCSSNFQSTAIQFVFIVVSIIPSLSKSLLFTKLVEVVIKQLLP